jgi:hypothetical protein
MITELHRQGDAGRALANLNAVDRIGLAPVRRDPQEMLRKQFYPNCLPLRSSPWPAFRALAAQRERRSESRCFGSSCFFP